MIGGVTAGIVDIVQACIQEGWDIPLYVAAGLLGRGATHGGAGTYILGLLLHFLIACSAAATYYLVSRKLTFLMDHPLVCGLFFGAAVEDFMRFVVLPLSAYHSHGPYTYHDLVDGLAMHAIMVGVPIAYSVRRWGR